MPLPQPGRSTTSTPWRLCHASNLHVKQTASRVFGGDNSTIPLSTLPAVPTTFAHLSAGSAKRHCDCNSEKDEGYPGSSCPSISSSLTTKNVCQQQGRGASKHGAPTSVPGESWASQWQMKRDRHRHKKLMECRNHLTHLQTHRIQPRGGSFHSTRRGNAETGALHLGVHQHHEVLELVPKIPLRALLTFEYTKKTGVAADQVTSKCCLAKGRSSL